MVGKNASGQGLTYKRCRESRFLHRRREVSKVQERWIFIECEAFGFAYEYLIWIKDCKKIAIVVERVKAHGNSVEVQGPR